jgi:hypothetical protein
VNTAPRQTWPVEFSLGLALLLVLSGPAWAAGPTLTNKELGFTLQMPEGFVSFDLPGRLKGNLAAFVLSASDPNSGPIIAAIDRGNGLLSRAVPQKKDLSEEMRRAEGLCIEKGLWGKEQIVVIWWKKRQENVTALIGQAYVPLAPCAILVTVTGVKHDKAELNGHLKAILAGLSGTVGRSSPTARQMTPDERAFSAGVAAGAVAGAVAGFWVVRRLKRSRKASQANAPGAGPASAGSPPTPPTL